MEGIDPVGADAKNLAREIASCASVSEALLSTSHPCSKVVREQDKLISVEIKRQRPEPWFGNLEQAKLLFVSSNPSINEDPYPLGEVFPTYEWSEDESASFFVNRCNQAMEPPYVTFANSKHPNFLTLCHDGEYRSGVSTPKRPQPTWNNTHKRAVELLGAEANPHSNYAITEIVHCKSKNAKGVEEASSFCVEKWMNSTISASPAKVIILLGSNVRDFYAKRILKADDEFGSNYNYGNLSQFQRASRDILIADIGGVPRVFVFNWHPTARALRVFGTVYGDGVVTWLQDIIAGRIEVPVPIELEKVIKNLFAR